MAASFRTLRASDHVRMPWKNGGGVTTEIAVHPPGAPLDAFDWRVSMADVASDGPFSMFPGVDRTLAVLEGNGLRLRMDGDEPARQITQDSSPLLFPADVPTVATLLKGPIRDLNVMTRRGRWRHAVTRIRGTGVGALAGLAGFAPRWLLLSHGGTAGIETGAQTIDLAPGDALLGAGAIGHLAVRTTSTLFRIDFWPVQTH